MAAVLVYSGGCSRSERSAASFCRVLRSEKTRILQQFNATSRVGAGTSVSALAGLGASLQAIGELRTYFHKLAKVAPSEIETEADIVAKQYDQLLDSMSNISSNPLAGLAGSLLSSVSISGQLNSLDTFARKNCGESI